MFAFQIRIKPAELFPLDDGNSRVECVEVRDLDVLGVDILLPVACERYAAFDMVALSPGFFAASLIGCDQTKSCSC